MADVPDPRRVLREAAERRCSCELMTRASAAVRGTIVRVEAGGVVVTAPGRRFGGGEDLRVWFSLDDQRYSFEASVLRVGAPVPDRSQDGVLLGFIDRWLEGEQTMEDMADCVIDLLPPNGPPVSLLKPPAQVIDVSLGELAFTVPASFTLVFVTKGTVRVRLGVPGHKPVEISARVSSLVPGEGSILYALAFQDVDDPDALREITAELDGRL